MSVAGGMVRQVSVEKLYGDPRGGSAEPHASN